MFQCRVCRPIHSHCIPMKTELEEDNFPTFKSNRHGLFKFESLQGPGQKNITQVTQLTTTITDVSLSTAVRVDAAALKTSSLFSAGLDHHSHLTYAFVFSACQHLRHLQVQ